MRPTQEDAEGEEEDAAGGAAAAAVDGGEDEDEDLSPSLWTSQISGLANSAPHCSMVMGKVQGRTKHVKEVPDTNFVTRNSANAL